MTNYNLLADRLWLPILAILSPPPCSLPARHDETGNAACRGDRQSRTDITKFLCSEGRLTVAATSMCSIAF